LAAATASIHIVAISKANFVGIAANVISCKGAHNKEIGFAFIQIINGALVKAAVTLPPRGLVVVVLAFLTAKYLIAFKAPIAHIPFQGHLTICMASQWKPYPEQKHKTEEYSSCSKKLEHIVSLKLLGPICWPFKFHLSRISGNEDILKR
jgi:hypothetical protein